MMPLESFGTAWMTRPGVVFMPADASVSPFKPGLPFHDLFSPFSAPTHRALAAAVRKCARACPSPAKDAGAAHRTLPIKNRNFLDLWQTIAQDLSRLFAVPGGCPSCPGSRKDWPEPLSCFRRPVPAPPLLPAAFRKALCAVWPEHDAHAATDMTIRGRGRTPFHPGSPSTAPGDRGGMAARDAAQQSHGSG